MNELHDTASHLAAFASHLCTAVAPLKLIVWIYPWFEGFFKALPHHRISLLILTDQDMLLINTSVIKAQMWPLCVSVV